jgi:autotransporter passenger strand-loop-strand repeat protein
MTIVTAGETLEVDTTWYDSATSSTVSGSVLYGAIGGPVYLSGIFTVNDTIVYGGGTTDVYDGGTAINSVINSGGLEFVESGATDISATISGGGEQFVYGTASSTVVGSGIVVGSSTFDAYQFVEAGGVDVGATVTAFSVLDVYSGGTASNTTIDVNTLLERFGSATLAGTTTIKSGGYLVIGSGYTESGFVSSNGVGLAEASSGTAIRTTIDSGGKDHVLSGGTAISATINSGG